MSLPEPEGARAFLRALWGDEKGVAELCIIGKKGVKAFPFTYPDSLDSFLSSAARHNKGSNVYYGVCLRRAAWKKGRGSEEDALSAPALWADLDFPSEAHRGETVTPEEARQRVAAFPLQPSIAIRTGGGVQLFWLFKSPVTGDDLKKIKSLNRAIAERLGADTNACDLARVLRIPGTINRKYSPPRNSGVSETGWFPDRRYELSDFTSLFSAEKAATPKTEELPSTPQNKPEKDLPREVIEKLGHLFSQIWRDGSRHSFALKAAGALAHGGISEEAALEVVRIASDSVGGETEKRLIDVRDTYRRFQEGHKIAGIPEIEKTINNPEKYPPIAKAESLKVLSQIRRYLPAVQTKRETPPSFTIKKFKNFPSDPGLWYIQGVTRHGEEFEVNCDTSTLLRYFLFQSAVYEQTYVMLDEMGAAAWKRMLKDAGKIVERVEAPREAKPRGAVESSLEEFVQDAKESPEETALKVFAGYDSEETFFRLEAFKRFLREQGHRIEDRILYQQMKELGWDTKVKRFGPRINRVWFKGGAPSNGNKSLEQKEPSLFPEEK